MVDELASMLDMFHLCLLARQLGIAFDPEAQQQGELRPKPGGQPDIRHSLLCLSIGGSAVLLQHLLLNDLSKSIPLQLTRTAARF